MNNPAGSNTPGSAFFPPRWSGIALLVIFMGVVTSMSCPMKSDAKPQPAMLVYLLLSGQVALWFASVFWLWRTPREDKEVPWIQKEGFQRWSWLYALAFLGAACAPAIGGEFRDPIATATHFNRWVIPALNLLGCCIAALHVRGIFVVHGEASRWDLTIVRNLKLENSSERDEFKKIVERYHQLRSHLHGFMTYIGAIIGAATLCAGAIRALVSVTKFEGPTATTASQFTEGAVLNYGLFFTILLTFVFIPAQHALSVLGRELAQRLSTSDLLKSMENWKSWSEEQEVIKAYLGMNQNPWLTLQSAITVLAPLVGSVSSLILGPGK